MLIPYISPDMNQMNELKKYLTINSLFSSICGLIMLIFNSKLISIFDIQNLYVFPVIGLNLVVFSGFVWYVSRKQLTNIILVLTISILDLVWVAVSFVIVFLGLFDISLIGIIIIILVANWIAFLAFKQILNNI